VKLGKGRNVIQREKWIKRITKTHKRKKERRLKMHQEGGVTALKANPLRASKLAG